jgi:hypothetical protein
VKKALLLFAVGNLTTFAATINAFNSRPVFIGATSDVGNAICASIGAANCELQSLIHSMNGAPRTNLEIDQETAGLWRLPGFNPSTSLVFRMEVTAGAAVQRLGIWSDADMDASTTGDRTLIDIFKGSATNNDVAQLSFNSLTGTMTIAGGSGVNNVTNAIGINVGAFGFYLQTTLGGQDFTWYSVDQLNPNGTAQALSFRNADQWFIGFEDVERIGGDRDHNDLIFSVTDIEVAPEPGFYVLVGLAMAVLCWVHRRHARN